MNKPLSRGGGLGRLLRLGVAFAALFLAFGAADVHAQADVLAASTLTGSANAPGKSTFNGNAPAATNWLSTADALNELRDEVTRLNGLSPATATAEALVGTQVEYYSYFADQLLRGADVAEAYSTSYAELARISRRFAPNARPDLLTLRQDALTLLSL